MSNYWDTQKQIALDALNQHPGPCTVAYVRFGKYGENRFDTLLEGFEWTYSASEESSPEWCAPQHIILENGSKISDDGVYVVMQERKDQEREERYAQLAREALVECPGHCTVYYNYAGWRTSQEYDTLRQAYDWIRRVGNSENFAIWYLILETGQQLQFSPIMREL